MAEQIISPGVFTRENDQSFITQQPVERGAAIIGPTVKGPVNIPTVVTSYSEFKNKFGTTFVYDNQVQSYLTSISAYNYFQNGGNTLLVTRVVSGAFSSATSTTVENASGSGNPATGSIDYLPGIGEGIKINYNNVNYFFLSSSTPVDSTNLNVYQYSGGGEELANEINTNVPTYFSASHDGTTLSLSASFSGELGNSIKLYTGSYTDLVFQPTPATASLQLDGGSGIPGNTFILKTIGEGVIMNSSGSEDVNGA